MCWKAILDDLCGCCQTPQSMELMPRLPPQMAKTQSIFIEPHLDYSDSQLAPSDNDFYGGPIYLADLLPCAKKSRCGLVTDLRPFSCKRPSLTKPNPSVTFRLMVDATMTERPRPPQYSGPQHNVLSFPLTHKGTIPYTSYQ